MSEAQAVMAGLVPAIHAAPRPSARWDVSRLSVQHCLTVPAWMPATSAGMTNFVTVADIAA